MPTISVIVPVYKAEKNITACVDSILTQTFPDFELILVDDGSPDNCGAICDGYAARDPRVKVIHKENGGAATARNAGLDAASGAYIAFVDADDVVHPQYLDFLLALIKKAGADIAMCHYDFFAEEGEWFRGEPEQNHELLNGGKLLAEFTEHCRKVSLISMCMKLYRREIFDGLRIPEGYIEEDSLVLPYILERAGTIARSEQKLYHWRTTPGSVTRSGLTERSFAFIEVSRAQAEFFQARGDTAQADYFKKQFLQRTLYYYYKVSDEKPELMEAFEFHRRRYCKLLPRYFMAGGLCARERLAYLLFPVAPKAARKFFDQVYKGESL